MKINTKVKLSTFSKESSVRLDMNYIDYILNHINSNTTSFNSLFKIIELPKVNLEKMEEFKYCQIGDVTSDGNINPVVINFEDRDEELNDYYKKIEKNDILKPEQGDILISKIRPYLKKMVFIDKFKEDIYFTRAFIVLRPKIEPRLAFSILRNWYIDNLNSIARIGKGYPTLHPEDLVKMKFEKNRIEKILERNKKEDISKKLYKIDEKIALERENEKELEEIINSVFCDYYKLDKDKIKTLGKGMTYGTQKNEKKGLNIFNSNAKKIARNGNLRLSTRFSSHNINDILKKIEKGPNLKIKDIYLEIIKGIQPQYDDTGIPVIKIANLRNKYIDMQNIEYANSKYAETIDESKYVKKNDIILCCIGKGSLGKVDIVEEETEAIVSVDNYILRIDESKYNPMFLTHYLRSIFGVTQFELNYTGATNQIHYYDYNILDMIIPNILLKEQIKIVNQINKLYSKQIKIKNKIQEEQEKEKKMIG